MGSSSMSFLDPAGSALGLYGGKGGGKPKGLTAKQQADWNATNNPVDLYSTFLRDVPSVYTKDRQLFVPNADYVASDLRYPVTNVPQNISMAERIKKLRAASPSIAASSGLINPV